MVIQCCLQCCCDHITEQDEEAPIVCLECGGPLHEGNLPEAMKGIQEYYSTSINFLTHMVKVLLADTSHPDIVKNREKIEADLLTFENGNKDIDQLFGRETNPEGCIPDYLKE